MNCGAVASCCCFSAVGFVVPGKAVPASPDHSDGGGAPVPAPARQWMAETDKSPPDDGHTFHSLVNASRAQCCAACCERSEQCDAHIRDATTGTCCLQTCMDGKNVTTHSRNREIGFMSGGAACAAPPGPPGPRPGPPGPRHGDLGVSLTVPNRHLSPVRRVVILEIDLLLELTHTVC